jgi:hypothetical protein
MAHWIPPVPVILESVVAKDRVSEEIAMARRCFDGPSFASAATEESYQATPAKAI